MFSATVTIFNYYEFSDGAVWYPHVLSNLHVETDRAVVQDKTGNNTGDRIQIHIPFYQDGDKKYITDADGISILYLPPKAWKKNELRESCITFSSEDFLMVGEWDGESPINDSDYQISGFYGYLNDNMDDVYKINQVEFYNVIPHFEITGA